MTEGVLLGMPRLIALCSAGLALTFCASTPAAPPVTTPPALGAPATVPPRTAAPTSAFTAVPTVASGTVVIEAGDHFFSPSQLTVAVGTTVVWRIVGQNAHDITARDGSFASSALNFGSTFTYIYNKPGRYPYVCTLHEGDGMFAEIMVVDR